MIEAGVLDASDRCELLEGEIVNKMPQSTSHATGVRLVEQALRAVYGAPLLVNSQLPLALGPRSEPEPDVFVVRGAPRDFIEEHPVSAVLVVEVSDTSLAEDRGRKQRIYARAGIEEFWIVNLTERQLEVYRAPAGEKYEESVAHPPSASVTLPESSTTVSVADLLP